MIKKEPIEKKLQYQAQTEIFYCINWLFLLNDMSKLGILSMNDISIWAFITVIQNGKFSAITVQDYRRAIYVTAAQYWTYYTSKTAKKLKKANEGHKGQMKLQDT